MARPNPLTRGVSNDARHVAAASAADARAAAPTPSRLAVLFDGEIKVRLFLLLVTLVG